MSFRRAVMLALALGLVIPRGAAAGPAPAPAARLADDIRRLSSDAFEGRAPGTAGETRTLAYLTRAFRRAGLEPAGTRRGGRRTWTQAVRLVAFRSLGERLSVTAGGVTRPWTQGVEVAVRAPRTGRTEADLEAAPVVFVGYGVSAPERGWDDYKGVDLHGKVALMLINDPDFAAAPDEPVAGLFGGRAMTYYGRWTYKFEEAARRGAAGVLIVHETEAAAYGWATVRNGASVEGFDIHRPDPAAAHAPLEGWIQHVEAERLFRAAGLDLAAEARRARRRDFAPVALAGVALSARLTAALREVVTHNLAGRLPGRGRADETVIVAAHWDHLGRGPPDGRGDDIYNGAVDNGSGLAALLEIARRLARGPRPARSVLFLALTAEEKGLLGSEHYVAHPLFPLDRTAAVLNLDALMPQGPTRDVSAAGIEPQSLTDDLRAAAARQGRRFTPDPTPEKGSFFRSDHFPFAQAGVPALSFRSGIDLLDGGSARGLALRDAYDRDHYHQPSDAFDPAWDLSGLATDTSLLVDLTRRLADSDGWPSWGEHSVFGAIRDRTAAARRPRPRPRR